MVPELLAKMLAPFSMALAGRGVGRMDGWKEASAGLSESPGWKNSSAPDAIGFLLVTHPAPPSPGRHPPE